MRDLVCGWSRLAGFLAHLHVLQACGLILRAGDIHRSARVNRVGHRIDGLGLSHLVIELHALHGLRTFCGAAFTSASIAAMFCAVGAPRFINAMLSAAPESPVLLVNSGDWPGMLYRVTPNPTSVPVPRLAVRQQHFAAECPLERLSALDFAHCCLLGSCGPHCWMRLAPVLASVALPLMVAA